MAKSSLLENKFRICMLLIVGSALSGFDDTIEPNNSNALIEPTETSLFAPGIAVVLQGKSYNFLNEEEGCEYVQYEIYVRNTSTNGEALENIVINNAADSQFIVEMGPLKGDDNLNGLLDVGETWEYGANRPIDESLFSDAKISSQVTVTAEVLGQFGTTVSDDSHPTSFANGDEGQTVVLVPCIAGISVITTKHQTKDTGGQDGGCAAIEYTIEVTHDGNPADSFINSELRDEKGINIFNLVSGDGGFLGRLEPGETWVYSVIYPITLDEITAGQAERQFYFETELLGSTPTVYSADISDYASPDEDRHTVTDLSHCVSEIALIRTGTLNVNCTQIGYTYIVTNEGNKDLNNVTLDDKNILGIINGPAGDIGNDGVLGLTEVWEYTATYNISQTDLTAGEVSNSATVEADVIEFPTLTISDESHPLDTALDGTTDIDLSDCGPGIAITKTGTLNACSSIDYVFTVTNQGDKDLEGVAITDNDIPGLVINGPNGDDDLDGELDFSEKWTYTATYAITAADLTQGDVQNQAQVEANVVGQQTITVTDLSHPSDTTLDADTITDVSSCTPGISILKTGTVSADCLNIDYTFTVENQGNQDLVGVAITDIDNLGLVINGPNGDLDLDGELDLMEIWTYTATYAITAGDLTKGDVQNQAQVEANVVGQQAITVTDLSHPSDVELDGNTISDLSNCQNPAIGMIKQATLADLDQDGCNESIFYQFTVANLGNVALTNLLLEDPLFAVSIAGPVAGSDDGNDGILSPNETWTYEVYYGITEQNLSDGDVINQATIQGWGPGNVEITDNSDDNSYDEDEPTQIAIAGSCESTPPGIALIKQGVLSDQDSDECPDRIRYTFTVANLGGETLQNVTIEDNFLNPESIVGPESGDANANNILDIGENWTYTAIYPLNAVDIEQGIVENQAAVTAQSVNTNQPVFDFSDDNSFDENHPTVTSVIGACSPDDDPGDDDPVDSDFDVFTGITPNGDGINDFFRINGIENYPNNVLKIFNRWGVLVYEAEGYGLENNLFSGISEGRATVSQERTLPSGTYFYTLMFEGENPGQESYSGYLYINRN